MKYVTPENQAPEEGPETPSNDPSEEPEITPGDTVKCIDAVGSGEELTEGSEYVVDEKPASWPDHIRLKGVAMSWRTNRFVKVKPEWVVGQQVSGDDYARLPVGSMVRASAAATPITKLAPGEWANRQEGRLHDDSAMSPAKRTLIHLGDPKDGDRLAWLRKDEVIATATLGPAQPNTEHSLGIRIEPETYLCSRCARPEEPTALGTVVHCHEGSVFVRVDTYGKEPWMRSGFDQRFSWDEIPTVERVAEGPAWEQGSDG